MYGLYEETSRGGGTYPALLHLAYKVTAADAQQWHAISARSATRMCLPVARPRLRDQPGVLLTCHQRLRVEPPAGAVHPLDLPNRPNDLQLREVSPEFTEAWRAAALLGGEHILKAFVQNPNLRHACTLPDCLSDYAVSL